MILGAKSNLLPSFIVIFFSIISCDNESTVSGNYLKINGFAQGSTFNIIYDDQRDLSSEINAVLTDFDKELSTYDNQSFISKINNSKDSCFSLTCFLLTFFAQLSIFESFNFLILPFIVKFSFILFICSLNVVDGIPTKMLTISRKLRRISRRLVRHLRLEIFEFWICDECWRLFNEFEWFSSVF